LTLLVLKLKFQWINLTGFFCEYRTDSMPFARLVLNQKCSRNLLVVFFANNFNEQVITFGICLN